MMHNLAPNFFFYFHTYVHKNTFWGELYHAEKEKKNENEKFFIQRIKLWISAVRKTLMKRVVTHTLTTKKHFFSPRTYTLCVYIHLCTCGYIREFT